MFEKAENNYMHMSAYVYKCVCMHEYMCVCMYVYMHVAKCVWVCMCVQMFVYQHIYIYAVHMLCIYENKDINACMHL